MSRIVVHTVVSVMLWIVFMLLPVSQEELATPAMAQLMKQEALLLRLGPIKGKAQTKGYEESIVIDKVSYGILQRGQLEDPARVTEFGEITFYKEMDIATPSLAYACSVKDLFPKSELVFIAGGREAYFKLTMEKVNVTSVSVEHEAGWARPKEKFTLRYRKALWEYGTAKAGFDLDQQKKM